jgi:two-component system, NtrC family, nitrogen regulation sensor histidine kinase NtrY
MRSLRSRLIVAFLAATILPFGATVWVTSSLLDRSLAYATTQELDNVSRTLERTVRQFYQRERESLRSDAMRGGIPAAAYGHADAATWPDPVRAFWESGEAEGFELAGDGGHVLEYMQRSERGVGVYTRELGVRMRELSSELVRTRSLVNQAAALDLRKGFTLTLFVLLAGVWLVALVPIVFVAHRISTPIRQLTGGLTAFADGDWQRRLRPGGDDEVGLAVEAFNRMADQLQRSRERLVYLTQMSSWQTLARKTAHELKNSLTPIRLTVEEMAARQSPSDRTFVDHAVQIVVSEIETLERRVRAFSELSSEPSVTPEVLDLNALSTERVALLRAAHPATNYTFRLETPPPRALASGDLAKGILNNLLENAADAAGAGGSVLVVTRRTAGQVEVQVHDSGPGLSTAAAATLFEPTITFKKHGMGLGLSIAKKNALLCGGDLTVIAGELGGAGFQLLLPVAGMFEVESA